MCDLRVGEYRKVWVHPERPDMYCCEIDLGNGEVRTIGSGVASYMSQDLITGQCLVFYNLKPRVMKGFTSNGMVLFACAEDHKSFELVHPPKGSKAGDRLFLEGDQPTAVPPLLSNGQYKKLKERSFKTFLTTDKGLCHFGGKALRT